MHVSNRRPAANIAPKRQFDDNTGAANRHRATTNADTNRYFDASAVGAAPTCNAWSRASRARHDCAPTSQHLRPTGHAASQWSPQLTGQHAWCQHVVLRAARQHAKHARQQTLLRTCAPTCQPCATTCMCAIMPCCKQRANMPTLYQRANMPCCKPRANIPTLRASKP